MCPQLWLLTLIASPPTQARGVPVGICPLANPEADVDRDEHIDRRGPKTPRLEAPLGNRRHGFPIEAPGVVERKRAVIEAAMQRARAGKAPGSP